MIKEPLVLMAKEGPVAQTTPYLIEVGAYGIQTAVWSRPQDYIAASFTPVQRFSAAI